jgi:Pseudouridine synthase
MYTLEQLAERPPASRDALLLKSDQVFLELPRVELGAAAVDGLLQGRTVAAPHSGTSGELRAYDGQGRFLGIVLGAGEGRVRPVRLFVDVEAGAHSG